MALDRAASTRRAPFAPAVALTREHRHRALLPAACGRRGVAAVIASTERRVFVKSMATIADHRVRQDVHQAPTESLVLYVKFQADVVTAFKVTSFKEG